jgi:hypothetical protein
VEWAKWHISSLPFVKIIVRQKIWRGRRDANMTGGGGEMAAAPGTSQGDKILFNWFRYQL